MDDKAMKESKDKAGWQWHPLRSKDNQPFGFGKMPQHSTIIAGSDYYSKGSIPVYDKVIPLHALKKVALIEKEFKDQVGMFVCDYAPAPQFNPDPFLMAVIANPRVRQGEGRFIVDFWDEPGFGIEQMLK
jgi:hypothetical protein